MDECPMWELNDLIDLLPYLDRNTWEIGRMNAYITAQVNSTKKLQMKDFGQFKWEEPTPQRQDISNSEIERLKKLSQQWVN